MNEKMIRNFHRRTGVFLALFILIQITTGTALSMYHLYEGAHSGKSVQSEAGNPVQTKGEASHEESEFEEILEFVHKKGGRAGDLFRIFLGAGIIFMAVSGGMINKTIKKRTKDRGGDA